jgi:hypothetical protein
MTLMPRSNWKLFVFYGVAEVMAAVEEGKVGTSNICVRYTIEETCVDDERTVHQAEVEEQRGYLKILNRRYRKRLG